MDICTLVIPTFVNAVGCMSTVNVCHFDLTPHTQREFCAPAPSICNNTGPYYQCVRQDKSTYTLDWSANKGPIDAGSNFQEQSK